jgi:hypothetical protein
VLAPIAEVEKPVASKARSVFCDSVLEALASRRYPALVAGVAVKPLMLSYMSQSPAALVDLIKRNCGSQPRFTDATPLPFVVNVPQLITF